MFSLTPKHVSLYFGTEMSPPESSGEEEALPGNVPLPPPDQMGDTETHVVSHD